MNVRKEFRERQAGVRQIETECGVLQGRDGVSRGKRTIAGGVHVLSLVEHSKVRVLSKRKYLCERERICVSMRTLTFYSLAVDHPTREQQRTF